jgi:hypothetical protein
MVSNTIVQANPRQGNAGVRFVPVLFPLAQHSSLITRDFGAKRRPILSYFLFVHLGTGSTGETKTGYSKVDIHVR